MEIDPTTVTKIYIGRDKVCRCGCAGSYVRSDEESSLFKIRLNRFVKMLSSYTPSVGDIGTNFLNISYGNDRAMTVYFD